MRACLPIIDISNREIKEFLANRPVLASIFPGIEKKIPFKPLPGDCSEGKFGAQQRSSRGLHRRYDKRS